MKKYIYLGVAMCLGIQFTSFCAVPAPSPELLGLKDEILRQRRAAELYVDSQYDALVAMSRQIPADVQRGLDRFFGDPRARRLFVDRCKKCVLSWPVKNRMQRDGGMRRQLLKMHEDAYASELCKVQLGEEEGAALFSGLSHDYGLVNCEKDGNCFVLTSSLWPGFVVKIVQYRWVDNDAMLAFPYQLISRAFYNRELNDFIVRNGYDRYIVRFPKLLYHIPGTPEKIDDDNYVVVEPLLACPEKQENERRFKMMIEKEGEKVFVKEEYGDAMCALIAVMQYCGLWSISSSNVYFLNDGKIAFIDTERPGLGGSEWRFFFHQGEGAAAEIMRNFQAGFDGLITDVLGTKVA